MAVLRVIVTVLYVLICIALVALVLFQESKTQGLSGTINGVAETYWGKNKGRSMEGALEKGTKILAALFIVLSVVLAVVTDFLFNVYLIRLVLNGIQNGVSFQEVFRQILVIGCNEVNILAQLL